MHSFGYYLHLLLHYYNELQRTIEAWGTRLVYKAGNSYTVLIIDRYKIMESNLFSQTFTKEFIKELISLFTGETVI